MQPIIDLHCDVLYRLSTDETLTGFDDERLQASYSKLLAGGVRVQFFAIFIDPSVPQEKKFLEAMRQIEFFHMKVVAPYDNVVHITNWRQLDQLKGNEIGAVLTLEGGDAIGKDLHRLQAFLDAGVKLMGLTWNEANAIADGADQPSERGLTEFGEKVVHILNEQDVIIDVSHLSEKSFWDVLPKAKHILASHSNARALCDHPRNLTDDQAKALIAKGGRIHHVYYPLFINHEAKNATITDLVNHFVYMAKLVGTAHIGFGSDFDGISFTVEGLEDAAHTPRLVEALHPHFSENEIHLLAHDGIWDWLRQI